MGNTILAHALFACNQADLDLDSFFSNTGNAHSVGNYKNDRLISLHVEHNNREDLEVILTVKCTGWDEVLRKKMSYAKWYQQYPTKDTFSAFGFNVPNFGTELEALTNIYFNSYTCLNNIKTAILPLGQYINNQYNVLIDTVETVTGWKWDRYRSNKFYQVMIEKNQKYITWLKNIQHITNSCIQRNTIPTELQFWEKAVVISKSCFDLGINPNMLHWEDYGCFLDQDNVTLINSIQRIQNG